MAKRVAASLARIERKSRVRPPKVNPRVPRQRTLQLLRKIPAGARLLREREAMGASSVPTQIDTPGGWVLCVVFGIVVLTTLLHAARVVVSVHARTAKTLLVAQGV
jgi:hypothetical protein